MHTVYIETSVVDHLVAHRSRDVVVLARQQATRNWWASAADQCRLVVSEAVIREVGASDPELASARVACIRNLEVVDTLPSAYGLAERLVAVGAMSTRAVESALHVAVAVTNNADFLLTWNYRHLAGATARREIETACANAGFEPTLICCPDAYALGVAATWSDPIVDEVRAGRNAHARKFGYDLKRIFDDLRERQEKSGRTYLRLPPRRITLAGTRRKESG